MILFVTKNKDTFNNPTLVSLFTTLEHQGKRSILLCEELYFKSIYKKITPITINKTNFDPRYSNITKILIQHLKYFLIWSFFQAKIETIIAIDSEGLIWANQIKNKRLKKVPLDYFSFELRFKYEYDRKKFEIEASKNIRNIIIQNNKRKELLFRENEISQSTNTFFIPVGLTDNLLSSHQLKPDFRKRHNIPENQKLVLFFGTFEKWAGSDFIMEAIEELISIENLTFVIHSRYPLDKESASSIKLSNLLDCNKFNIIISEDYIENFSDALNFIKEFDVGLCLYCPDYNVPYLGENIFHLGLSSGKFSLFMKAGIPTITTRLPIFEELNGKYNFGSIIDSSAQLIVEIKKLTKDNESRKLDCLQLFEEKLNPSKELQKYINLFLN